MRDPSQSGDGSIAFRATEARRRRLISSAFLPACCIPQGVHDGGGVQCEVPLHIHEMKGILA